MTFPVAFTFLEFPDVPRRCVRVIAMAPIGTIPAGWHVDVDLGPDHGWVQETIANGLPAPARLCACVAHAIQVEIENRCLPDPGKVTFTVPPGGERVIE